MILSQSDVEIIGGSFDDTTDVSAFYQLSHNESLEISKASLTVNFPGREIMGLEKWQAREDTPLTTLKDLEDDVLQAVLENFPVEVIKNYLI